MLRVEAAIGGIGRRPPPDARPHHESFLSPKEEEEGGGGDGPIDGAAGARDVRRGYVVHVGVGRRARQAPGLRRPRPGPPPRRRGAQDGPRCRLHVPLRVARPRHAGWRLQPSHRALLRLLRWPRRVPFHSPGKDPCAGEFLCLLGFCSVLVDLPCRFPDSVITLI